MGLILITHDLRVAFSMCGRIYVLYAGSVLEVGDAAGDRIPAAPSLHPGAAPFRTAAGQTPWQSCRPCRAPCRVLIPSPHSCPFAPRCAGLEQVCRCGKPLPRSSRCPTSHRPASGSMRSGTRWRRRAPRRKRSAHVTLAAPVSDDRLVAVDGLTKVFDDSGARGRHVALKGVTL